MQFDESVNSSNQNPVPVVLNIRTEMKNQYDRLYTLDPLFG